MTHSRGYTLVELVVAVGLFAFVMMLAAGAYLMMIGLNQQAQGLATGIDSLSFALDTMTRDIRTGSDYCGLDVPACTGTSFSFHNKNGVQETYTLTNDRITMNGVALTDPIIHVTSLSFVTSGTGTYASGDNYQAMVRIVASGSVPYGHGKSQNFVIESSATMRGADI